MDLSIIIFTFNVVVPVFLIILLGFILKRIKFLETGFAPFCSKIVFNIALPALIFIKLHHLDLKNIIDFSQIGFCYFGIISTFLLAWALAKILVKNDTDQGAFIHACFRSNTAIISLPLVYNAFGEQGLVNIALVLTALIPLNNSLGVLSLTLPKSNGRKADFIQIAINILKNPLIMAAIAAGIFSYVNLPVGSILFKTGNYLANLTIPLALLAIGSSLSLTKLRLDIKPVLLASAIKIMLMPLIFTAAAIWFGFRGVELATIFFLFSAPVAVSSYIMAEAMEGNSNLASSSIVISTTFSVITISIGTFLLRFFGFF
ncbi:AEC family transporter [Candidatus Margulisiibacteriota bacterium]